MTQKPILLIAESEGFSPKAIELLKTCYEVRTADLDRAGLLSNLSEVETLWIRLRSKIDKEVIDVAPKLKAIVTNTTGLTHIDFSEVSERKIEVVSLRGETEFLRDIRATAEHTLGLLLALLRSIPSACNSVHEGRWDRYPFKGREIFNSTVGIIGYGRLGELVAKYLIALGATVLVNDIAVEKCCTPSVKYVDLNTLLLNSDIISLHTDFRPENRKMIGREQFNMMKTGAVFINTARGQLVDEAALLEALDSGKLCGAALDVLDDEYQACVGQHPLVMFAKTHANLLITPHIGGYAVESLHRTELFLASKLIELRAQA